MIDKIKLLVLQCLNKEFIANSDSPRLVRMLGRKYFLFNRFNDHHLEIIQHPDGVIITGSLRKWYFGKNSYKDLTPYQILEVFYEIEFLTGLSVDALLDASTLIMEWGAIFFLPISASAIVNSMFRYSNLPLGKYDTSISFRGYNYWLAIYDKTAEINKYKKKTGNADLANANTTLRIELKLFKNTAFKSKLRGCRTVRQVLQNYRKLIVSFLYEIERIEMKPISLEIEGVKVNGKPMKDVIDYIMFLGMDSKDIRRSFKLIDDSNASSRVKSYYRNKFREILAIYGRKGTYRKVDFIDGVVKKQLAKMISVPIPLL